MKLHLLIRFLLRQLHRLCFEFRREPPSRPRHPAAPSWTGNLTDPSTPAGEAHLWDQDAVDLVEPGSITFKGQDGEMRFIAVRAWLDVRYGTRNGGPIAEFFHKGDDSGFVCERS